MTVRTYEIAFADFFQKLWKSFPSTFGNVETFLDSDTVIEIHTFWWKSIPAIDARIILEMSVNLIFC